MAENPVGDLCVLKDEGTNTWSVSICWGGIREPLAKFDDAHKAGEFAVAERNRRLADGEELTIHYPDDCPCLCIPPLPA